jgi:4-amino-4-deoxy-L-arabinose transferase-like glycosyltransferase
LLLAEAPAAPYNPSVNSKIAQYLPIALLVLLVAWGVYTVLVYFGMPVHTEALLSTDLNAMLSPETCGPKDIVCLLGRGAGAILPILWYTLVRAAPFLWYAIITIAAYGAYVVWKMTKGETDVKFSWTPWKLVLAFVAATWLMSTTLSYGSADGRAVRLFVEPTQESYNVTPDVLAVLQTDYQQKLAGGCLTPLTDGLGNEIQSQAGSKLYNLTFTCMEAAFISRVLTQMLFVLALLFEFLVLGRGVLWLCKVRPKNVMLEALLSTATGAGAWIVLLWLVAIAGIYVSTVGWLLVIAIPAICFAHSKYWIDQFLHHRWETEGKWYSPSVLLPWLLISLIAINFLEVVRPFPIGWDDLGSYLNRPRLLVSYGHFIFSMSPFDWTYLTSFGFLLFGYNNPFGSTASMLVNWSAGVLALLSVYGVSRTFLGKRAGWLSALLYYSLPLVGHFSFADMKIDNAVFFFGAVATLAMFLGLMPDQADDAEHAIHPADNVSRIRLILLSGVFVGLAFATKSTAIMVALALAAMLMGIALHWTAFAGMVAVALLLFSWQGVLSVQDILARSTGSVVVGVAGSVFTVLCIAAIGGFIGYAAYKAKHKLKRTSLLILAFGIGVAIAVIPWIEHNTIEHGGIIPTKLELSAPNRVSPGINIYDDLPADLAVNREAPQCKPSGAKEELDRYWGFEQGWSHYLTLTWRSVMNIDATGYYVTTIPAFLLFPLLLLLPYFWSKKGRWLRWLFWSTLLIVLQWTFVANGIPWYGIGVMLGLVVGLEALFQRSPDKPTRIVAGILIGLSLVSSFGMRLWQFEQQRNILEYSMGKVSADVLRRLTIPYYDDIAATAVQRHETLPDRPYMYRIGTFIPYFVPKNLEVIGMSDHQLDSFNCLYAERDAALTTKRLKALGFNSIIFDTNTATIERDENGSLHQKVNTFVDYINNPASGMNVAVSDTAAGVAFIIIP